VHQRELWQIEAVAKLCGSLSYHSKTFVENNPQVFIETMRTLISPDDISQMVLTQAHLDGYKLEPETRNTLVQQFNEVLEAFKAFDLPGFKYSLEEAKQATDIRWGLIHQDIHDENLCFDVQNKVITGLLDWEDLCLGPFVLELAFCMIIFPIELDWSFNISWGRTLLDAYQTIRSLTEAEKSALWQYCILAYLHYYNEMLVRFEQFEIFERYVPSSLNSCYTLVKLGPEEFKKLMFD
jgi:Ser/Thr protein kinase RdoA (MazF antagonist)